MATVVSSAEATVVETAPPEPRQTRPIVGWAVVGVFFLVIEIIAVSGWILSGEAKKTDPGPTPVPTWMKWTLHSYEVAGVVALVAFLYFVLVRPWRREGRITTDGLFCFVFLLMPWQDTTMNAFQPWLTYNAYLFNLGSWNNWIVGWLYPNGNLIAEPLVWLIPVYVYGAFGAAIGCCWLMRKAKARWPNLNNFSLIALCAGCVLVGDAIVEPLWMMLGFYTYPGAMGPTLYKGNYFQWPLIDGILVACWVTSMACIRYFINDKGENLGERGLNQLRVTGKRKTIVHFLALNGAMTMAFMVYDVPAAVVGLYSSPWPKDITSRSYYLDGLCGPGTNNACPGPAIPVPRRDSAHVGMNGELIVPAGTNLPGLTR